MKAYPDSKCVWGYMTICDTCVPKAPRWVDTTSPIADPPAIGKRQACENCSKLFILEGGRL